LEALEATVYELADRLASVDVVQASDAQPHDCPAGRLIDLLQAMGLIEVGVVTGGLELARDARDLVSRLSDVEGLAAHGAEHAENGALH
jgi:hypothetical protein